VSLNAKAPTLQKRKRKTTVIHHIISWSEHRRDMAVRRREMAGVLGGGLETVMHLSISQSALYARKPKGK
jgi:hypothetical protein